MSRTSNKIVPASGRSSPEICAIAVVLPAPFGQIIACISPVVISKDNESVALRAPKALSSLLTSINGSFIVAFPPD